MSEQSTVDADVQVTEPSVPPPPPPDAADLPRAVSVAPEVTGVDDSAVDHSWLSELETAAPLSAATATAAAAAAPVEAQNGQDSSPARLVAHRLQQGHARPRCL